MAQSRAPCFRTAPQVSVAVVNIMHQQDARPNTSGKAEHTQRFRY